MTASAQGDTADENRIGVALHFDESDVEYGQIDREVFAALLAVIPREWRDLRVALKLFGPDFGALWPTPTALALHLLGGSKARIHTSHSVNALATLVQTTPIVYASITGLRESDLDFLHDDLLDRSTAYLGFLSLDDRLPAHVEFYGGFPQYRVLGAELRLLYSAAEYSPEFGIEDTRPSDALAEWRDAGMFSRVDWEEDEEHSRHARKIAEQYADWLLNGGSSGEPPP